MLHKTIFNARRQFRQRVLLGVYEHEIFFTSINMCICNKMNPLSAFNNILCLQSTSFKATARTRLNKVQQKIFSN